MLKALLLLVLSIYGNEVAVSLALSPTLNEIHHQCQEDAIKLCPQGITNFELDSQNHLPLPIEELRKLTHDQVTYPALGFDVHTDVCLWQAFLHEKINDSKCIHRLQGSLSRLDKKINQGDRTPVFIDLTNFFLESQHTENHYSTFLMYYPESFLVHSLAFFLHQFALGQHLYRGIENMFLKMLVAILSLLISFLLSLTVPKAGIVVASLDLLLLWFFEDEEDNNFEDKTCDEDFAYVAIPIQLV